MQFTKLIGGAVTGAAMMLLASTSAYAVTIGFSQVGDEGDWRPAFSKDMQEEAKKEGIDLKFADAQGKEEEQLKAVRAFIAQKVDAIIIAPVVVTGWDQVLKEAKRAGIPVFLADRDVDVKDKSLFVTRISADFNLEGRLAGAWLALLCSPFSETPSPIPMSPEFPREQPSEARSPLLWAGERGSTIWGASLSPSWAERLPFSSW